MEDGEVCVYCENGCDKCFVNNNIYVCFEEVPKSYFESESQEIEVCEDINEIVLCIESRFFE